MEETRGRRIIRSIGFLALILTFTGLYANFPNPSHQAQDPEVAVATNPMERAIKLRKAGKYYEAQAAFQKCADTGGDPEESLSGVAECLINRHLYEEARAVCDLLKSRVPKSGRAYYLSGLAFQLEGHKASAMVEFKTAKKNGSEEAAFLLSPPNRDKLR